MSSKFNFLPEMDVLRALAVIMTLGAHFLPETGSYHIPYLWYGVDLFFVISGFLITSILLKTTIDKKESDSNFKIIKNFYARRILRLFPIYYLFILFFFLSKHLFNLYLWKDEFNPYFFTYFQNWYFFKIGALNSMFSHLWSLGVEEQFYIIWPFILVFIPIKKLSIVFWGIVMLSLILNSLFYQIPVFRNLTFSNLHTLGGGALLAYYYCLKPENKVFKGLINNRILLLVISFIIFLTIKILSPPTIISTFVSELLLAITAVMFVTNSVYGWPKVLKPITSNGIINHIGKVSYGIYLFHLPIPALIIVLMTKLHLPWELPSHPLVRFLILFMITYLLATLSYRFIEKRFLMLKPFFE